MIVCAIDDLMFSIKASTAAKSLKADVYFERPGDKLMENDPRETTGAGHPRPEQRAPPSAGRHLRPQARSGPERQPKTLGYVSHVDTATIDAARAAGIDQVMARSALVTQLGEILKSA